MYIFSHTYRCKVLQTEVCYSPIIPSTPPKLFQKPGLRRLPVAAS